MSANSSVEAGVIAEPHVVGLGAGQLTALKAWLEDRGVEIGGPLTASLIAGGRSNLTYKVTDGEQCWVLRRPPLGGRTPSAHDVVREFRVCQALEATRVPVARTVGSSQDAVVIGAPFTIVEFVDGTAIRAAEEVDGLGDDVLASIVGNLVTSLADLHSVEPAAVGLADLGRSTGYAQRQLWRWSGQWDTVGARASVGAATAAREVSAILGGSIPPQPKTRIVHGDYRIDNTLVDPRSGGIRAIVDWELSTLGDPVADVALMCVYRERPLNDILGFEAAWSSPRFPGARELAAHYEQASGSPLPEWEFWMALSAYKVAVIAAGIEYRWRAGGTVGDGFATAGLAVEPLMELAHSYAVSLKGPR